MTLFFFSKLYESFKKNMALNNFISDTSFKKILSITNTKIFQLNLVQQVCRIDVSGKNKNLLNTHQDMLPGVKQNNKDSKFVGFTVWCPLHKSNKYYGGLALIPNSHKYGCTCTYKEKSNKKGKSDSYIVSANALKNKKINLKSLIVIKEMLFYLILCLFTNQFLIIRVFVGLQCSIDLH